MELERKIAKITDAFLGVEDHGIWTASLTLDYGNGSAQGTPGFGLDRHVERGFPREGTAFGMTFIMRLCSACGVQEWGELVGRTVYALIGEGMVRGIEPLPTEPGRLFMFDGLAAHFRNGDGEVR